MIHDKRGNGVRALNPALHGSTLVFPNSPFLRVLPYANHPGSAGPTCALYPTKTFHVSAPAVPDFEWPIFRVLGLL